MSNFCVSTAATSSDIDNLKKNTLRNILSTITSLAIDTSTSHLIVFHGDGALVELLKAAQVRAVGERGARGFDGDGFMAIAFRAAVRGGGRSLGAPLACGGRHGD